MNWKELLFTFNGRISRKPFWLVVMVMISSGILCAIIIPILPQALKMIPLVVLGLISVWSGLAVAVKRWHDRDKSGWWVLIGLIPIIGPIWAWVENGFLRGTEGANRFGPDPLNESQINT